MLVRRRLLDHPAIREIACRFVAFYIRLVWKLGRWTIENEEIAARFVEAKRPFIACFWHGRLLVMSCAWRYPAKMHIVISRHRDGRFIARTMDHLGISTIAGSSSKGGRAALRDMLQLLGRGDYVGVTPDGPRGPRMRVGNGIVRAARLAGVPLLPITFSASRRHVLRSWDRFVLPLPFGRGTVQLGPAIEVPANADDEDIERIRGQLETSLNDMTRELDARYGHAPIAPADASERPKRRAPPALPATDPRVTSMGGRL
jgi:lysophospholipid acyltransferase (LPLAT)-like uncharacterized protein